MRLAAATLVLFSLLAAAPTRADAPAAGAGADVDIVEELGAGVPMDLPFVDSAGVPMRFGDVLKGRPVILALVYHRCRGLCSLLLGGLVGSLRAAGWRVGRELDVVTVSIDPDEAPTQAEASRIGYVQALGLAPAEARWASLTGAQSSIDALASAVGFRFKYVDGQRQFAHAAALFVLTPDGRVSRYLYGVEFPPTQLKAAVFEAAGGRVGTSFDRLILRCLRWDPSSRRYHLFLARYFRGVGVTILLGLGALFFVLWRRDPQGSRA